MPSDVVHLRTRIGPRCTFGIIGNRLPITFGEVAAMDRTYALYREIILTDIEERAGPIGTQLGPVLECGCRSRCVDCDWR